MRRFPLLAIFLAVFTGGCVVAKLPLDGLGERESPLGARTTLEVFRRADARSSWKQDDPKEITLIGRPDKSFRSLDESGGLSENGSFTLHTIGKDRYLVQMRFGVFRYGYAVVQIQNGEGLISPLTCKAISTETLTKSGMKMVADDCWLEDAKDPVAFLKALAANPPAPTVKYVPVKSK